MKQDFIVEILEFGKTALLNNGQGITFEETLKHLTDKGIQLKNPAVIWEVLNTCFRLPPAGNPEGRHILKTDAYFSHLEYIELQEARKSSRSANFFAVSALIITILTSAFSVYYSKLQIDSPTEIKQSQIDSVLNLHRRLHQEMNDLKKILILRNHNSDCDSRTKKPR